MSRFSFFRSQISGFRFQTAMLLLLASCAMPVSKSEWGKVTTPTSGETKIYGSYSNGCLAGAREIPLKGSGFMLARGNRGRHYAHPAMLEYLYGLGAELQSRGSYVLVADVSQPRGGPIIGGHNSHQIGLDADIWYWRPDVAFSRISTDYTKNIASRSMVRMGGISPEFGAEEFQVIKTAAARPEVDRIFVNSVIKRELCRLAPREPWMMKVRPWWGHESHFHVRLKCPNNERSCVPQPGVTSDNGCDGELSWWFGAEAMHPQTKDKVSTSSRTLKHMPKQCMDVLKAL